MLFILQRCLRMKKFWRPRKDKMLINLQDKRSEERKNFQIGINTEGQ